MDGTPLQVVRPTFLSDPMEAAIIGAPFSFGQPFTGTCEGPEALRAAGLLDVSSLVYACLMCACACVCAVVMYVCMCVNMCAYVCTHTMCDAWTISWEA